ncbi:hypothetical protein DIPPA_28875 [Diplonema papillatum]|nr:hypothetical protein DIPPA_28875 [Diplonema papillatum]
MTYSPAEVEQILHQSDIMKRIYQEVGEIPRDVMVTTRHVLSDHIFGPQHLSDVLHSSPRWRPADSRLLMEHKNFFFFFEGCNRVIGASWLAGIAFGGLQGFYEGLAVRRTRSWRTAYQSLNSFSRTKGPLKAHQFAAVATCFSLWEAGLRYALLTNEEKLEYGEKGLVLGHFGSSKAEEKLPWQTDGRMIAPPAAALTAVSLRLLKGGAGARASVLLSNACLAAAAGYLYSHMWEKRDYWDVSKKFLEL